MIPAIGLVVGVVLGFVLQPTVPPFLQPYLPIMIEHEFDDRVFVVSFLSNTLVAALIVFLGDQLGVGSQLSTAVVVVLGIRIFSNVASIRRQVFRA